MPAWSGLILTVTGFLACPCHLPLTVPLLLTLLGGTSLGFFLQENTGVIFAAASAYFLVALGAGLFLLNRSTPRDGSATCCVIDPTAAAGDDQPRAGLDNARNALIRR